eukprot:gene54659-56070_t
MEDAAREADAHDAIRARPDGRLSGGERQRIALARHTHTPWRGVAGVCRAFLRRPRLLVYDEATAALDPRAEEAVLAALGREMTFDTAVDPHYSSGPSHFALALGRNRRRATALVIAHRLSTLKGCDRVAVGTPADLLRKGGLFADMWRRQSGWPPSSAGAVGRSGARTAARWVAQRELEDEAR